MMAGPSNDKCISSVDCGNDPPPLNITLKKTRDLPKKVKHWSIDHLPVDILLLTVENCEFLACYHYLRDPFRSYEQSIGNVYFGKMGEDEDGSVKVAIVRCFKESSDPGGTQTATKNAVTLLKPKATFLVGFCYSLNPNKAQLGDVVISSKLTTDFNKTPVSRDVGKLIKSAADGWEAPLENLEAQEVNVCDGEILSCSDLIDAEKQCQSHPGAIAIEMEGKGLFAAAHDMKMEWLVVKGVCGFVQGAASTNDSWKTFACVMAASVVSNILSNSFVFRDWPPYGDISTEESCKSDGPSENKRRRLADISTGEEGCKSDDPSERLEEPFNVEKCQDKLKSFYDTFNKVKIVPWDESSSIQIDEIYIPLSWMRNHRMPSGVTQEELEDYTDMFKGKPTRMLVYGQPGIGKSTFCKKAAYDWSKTLKEILKNFYVLILIKLRDVCDAGNIRDVLHASKLLASDGPISVNSLYDYIINNQDKVLLILDGYDEYSCAKEHSPILKIWKGEQLRDCHIIVTTRQLKCDELRGPSHVQLEIQGFNSQEQKESFVRKFLVAEQDPNEFIHYLSENDLDDMAKIPLLLLMLCTLWKEKHHVGLPKSRADIFTQFIQTMLDHKGGSHQSMPFQKVTSTEAKEDLSNLGKAAFEALVQDRLYVRCSELPGNISRSFQKLSEVGLFQIVNLTSLNPEKGAYFIHKSVQEFLAAWHIKEEVLSIKGESAPSLSKVESFEEIRKMYKVLEFACELSTEAACAVFHHVGSVGRKESVSECNFMKLLLENEGPSINEQLYIGLISYSYFCCSAEKMRDLCSAFPSFTAGAFSYLDYNKVNITANEHLLKSGMIPDFIFFPPHLREDSSGKSYRDLITIAEDTNAVFLSCSGEKKAADFLKKYPRRSIHEFFLKRERKIVVYVHEICKDKDGITFPTEMLRELISLTAESTQVTRLVDPLNEHDSETASSLTQNTDSITGPTPQSLSFVKRIDIVHIERQEIKMLADFLPLFTALRWIVITGKPFEIIDAQLTETLVSRIIFTDRLDTLALSNINLTAKPTAAIARSLHQAPSLRFLDLSENPLGEGVSVLTQHLSRVPHLEMLTLLNVKMTRQQVNDLSAAVRQSNISWLNANYHDDKGNVKPEEEWPTDEYWRKHLSKLEEESNPWSVTDSGDEEEPGSVTTSGDEEDPGSVTDSSDKEDPGLVTDSGDKEEPGSCLET